MVEAKPTILFVDDEGSILDGLRRSLHGQNREWAPDGMETEAARPRGLDMPYLAKIGLASREESQ